MGPALLERMETVATADGPMVTLLRCPEGAGPYPVIVMYHDGLGLHEDIHALSRRLAQLGYLVAVPDLFHRSGTMLRFDPAKVADEPAESARIMTIVRGLTDEMVAADTADLLEVVRSQPRADGERLGCVGYCLGARAVLRTMVAMPDEFAAGSALHPSFCVTESPDSPHLGVPLIRGEVYFAFGEADRVSPLNDQRPLIQELRKLGGQATIDIFPNADHGFAFAAYPSYEPAAAARSWTQTINLFDRNLRGAGQGSDV